MTIHNTDHYIASAFVLSVRAYKETSALVVFFSAEHGVFRVIVKGLYNQTKQKLSWQGSLRPFIELTVRFKGQDPKYILDLDDNGECDGSQLKKNYLYSGLYLNELLNRCMLFSESCVDVYESYKMTVRSLMINDDIETALRRFELELLKELGYGISFQSDIYGAPMQDNDYYCFDPEKGFIAVYNTNLEQQVLIKGVDISAMSAMNKMDKRLKRIAKYVLRTALAPHLGQKPLVSAQFFK